MTRSSTPGTRCRAAVSVESRTGPGTYEWLLRRPCVYLDGAPGAEIEHVAGINAAEQIRSTGTDEDWFPEYVVYRTRLGLITADLAYATGARTTAARILNATADDVLRTGDGYAAREITKHPETGTNLTPQQRNALNDIVVASGLRARAIRPDLRQSLESSTKQVETVLHRTFRPMADVPRPTPLWSGRAGRFSLHNASRSRSVLTVRFAPASSTASRRRRRSDNERSPDSSRTTRTGPSTSKRTAIPFDLSQPRQPPVPRSHHQDCDSSAQLLQLISRNPWAPERSGS